MAGALQRIFSAEQAGKERLREAERHARQIETDARAKADEAVRAAEKESKELLVRAIADARSAAEARKAELGRELEAREAAWRLRYEQTRESIIRHIVRLVLGEEAAGD